MTALPEVGQLVWRVAGFAGVQGAHPRAPLGPQSRGKPTQGGAAGAMPLTVHAPSARFRLQPGLRGPRPAVG
jgi:hypothetical protein